MVEQVAVEKPQTGAVTRQEFGAVQVQRTAETAASAVAAQAAAMIQARYVMAMQRPRDLDQVRVKIMREVERPGFAEAAWYRKPIGAGVEGLTVRFAEAAARCMGNISHDAAVIYEDQTQRIVRLTVTDIENNIPYSKDIVVTKTVERKTLKAGQVAIGSRLNSQGQMTFLVEATDDEILSKENSLLSKQYRTFVEKILPGDIKDAAKTRIKEIRAGAVALDPDGARIKIAAAFATIGVMPAQLKVYLGHELESCSPAEIQELRDVYSAINTGEATWAEVMEGRTGEAPVAGKGLDPLKEKLRAQAEEKKMPGPGYDPESDDPRLANRKMPDAQAFALPAQPGEGTHPADAPYAEKEPEPCQHRPLWKLAKHADPNNKMVCADCDRDVPVSEILMRASAK